LHTNKVKKQKSLFLKLDLRKAYDKVNWNFLRMVLIQVGLKWEVVQWVIDCVTSSNFSILVNGAPNGFFKGPRGLRKGCPLSPVLFLLVIEAIRRQIKKAQVEGKFTGLRITKGFNLTHLMFIDDVLIMGIASLEEWLCLKEILDSFCQASRLEINYHKSMFFFNNVEPEQLSAYEDLYDISFAHIDSGFKYLGFFLKPNDYKIDDWRWLVKKLENKLGHWTSHWLSLGGRLTLLNSTLQNLPVYWLTLAKVPCKILNMMQHICSNFLWRGVKKSIGYRLENWDMICWPKSYGGWGIRNLT